MVLTTENYSTETRGEYGHAYATLNRILETVETYFEQAGVPLPTRRFVAVGDVASNVWDCEQLSVNLVNMYLGTPGTPSVQPRGCELAMSGDFVVQLVRCVPTPKVAAAGRTVKSIPVADLLSIAEVEAIDCQLLLEASWGVSSAQGVVSSIAPTGVEGSYQAVAMTMSVSLFE